MYRPIVCKLDNTKKPKIHKLHKLHKSESECVLLYPEGIVTLNTSSCEILKMCNGNNTVLDIKKNLYSIYNFLDEADFYSEIDTLLLTAYSNNWIIA